MVSQYHLVTIRKPDKLSYTSQHDLDWAMYWLHQSIPDLEVIDLTYELGRYNQLHLHAVCKTTWSVVYRRYTKSLGLRLNWRRLKHRDDVRRAIAYIYKEQLYVYSVDKNSLKPKGNHKQYQEEILQYNNLRSKESIYKLFSPS